ncbi:hypothetical protein [Vogesella mureinivorans]|uniref:hypothetical protein n=1 Tax=Vogesella mureinivorans TaxID=657276 RepID=UPI0011C8995B|nr:hypothetical protein [Vogesella mureinivorans]
MSDYRVTVTVPVDHRDTASAIGRAMDIDVGGADSFIETDGVLAARTWASAEFATMFEYLIARPEALYMAVATDYGARWPELVPPDLKAIETFCQAASMTIEPPLQ